MSEKLLLQPPEETNEDNRVYDADRAEAMAYAQDPAESIAQSIEQSESFADEEAEGFRKYGRRLAELAGLKHDQETETTVESEDKAA